MSDTSIQDMSLNVRSLPVGTAGRRGVGYWGLLTFLASEAALFGYLIFSYAYIGVQLDPSLAAAARLSFTFAVPMTIVVIISSIVLSWGERAIQRGRTHTLAVALIIALILSISFVVLELFEWKSLPFTLTSSALSSAYFLTTGMHLAHFIAGIIALLFFIPWVMLGYFDAARNTHVLVIIDYWHFVHAVWGVIFIAIYCVPYLG
ncbi:MAG TPA: cytochrome c oxidase subunit 3 [Methylovirgula sp.]|jgi:cytochrome c oxidase subunit 3|nr:cytochrome c oxidase subunit 3 [Methylovirgula sp.]